MEIQLQVKTKKSGWFPPLNKCINTKNSHWVWSLKSFSPWLRINLYIYHILWDSELLLLSQNLHQKLSLCMFLGLHHRPQRKTAKDVIQDLSYWCIYNIYSLERYIHHTPKLVPCGNQYTLFFGHIIGKK